MLSFFRVVKNGYLNFYRNGVLTGGALIVITACLVSINLMLLVSLLTDSSIKLISNQVDINLELNESIQQSQIELFQQKLMNIPQITDIHYYSAQDVLSDFQKNHPEILSFLNEQSLANPLPARINLQISQPLERNQIIEQIKQIPQVTTFINLNQLNQNLNNNHQIKKFLNLITWLRKLFVSLTIFFVFITILVIINTIKLTILSQKEEIKTMQLVGAQKSYILGPFLIEGILYGIIAGVLSTLIVFPFISISSSKIAFYFQQIPLNFENSFLKTIFPGDYWELFSFYQGNLFSFLSFLIISGSFLGLVASLLAIRKAEYLQ